MKVKCYCPELTPEEFEALDLKEVDLTGKCFYIAKTPMLSHFPVNPELKLEKTLAEMRKKGFEPAAPLFVLFEDGLLFGSIMVEVCETQARHENIRRLTGFKVMGKAFSGPKHLIPKALKQFDGYLMSRKHLSTEFFFWYHSCKGCEKEKGCRTVIYAKIK